MKIGFIGTGAITEAIVTGLCTSEIGGTSIWVSPRNALKAESLRRQFSQVAISLSNQDVIDKSDIIVLAFLPIDRAAILESLCFRNDQVIISLLSGTRNAQVAALIKSECVICRAVPLPFVAEHIGPVVLYPGNTIASQLFKALGTVISAETEEELEVLSVITSLMAPYFEMLASITDWAVEAGVRQKLAADYTAAMFEALSVLARKTPGGDLHKLADESMTPGGLNELARKIIRESGGYRDLLSALDAVSARVTAKRADTV